MLSHITIKDFAIIDEMDLDFHQGFHIFTGETGAGKSIIIEAISMALGNRADTAYVRSGKNKAIIELTVVTKDPDILTLLKENGLEESESLLITREIYAAGKSSCRINGVPVSVTFLNTLCKKIADIHGQYDHQSLLNPDRHIVLIDEYRSCSIGAERKKAADLFHRYTEIKKKLDTLIKNQVDSERKRDFMKFELEEIQNAKLIPDEDTELKERLLYLQNSELIFEHLSTVYELLYQQTSSCQDNLSKSVQQIQEIQSFSNEIPPLTKELSDCYYKLEALQPEIRKVRDSITFSPELLNEAMERIDLLDRLKRKYGGTLEKVIAYQGELTENLSHIENLDQRKDDLAKDLLLIEDQLVQACQRLSKLRKEGAKEIENKINNELKELNFKDAKLIVNFSDLTDSQGNPVYSETGMDQVEFLMITNKGESPKPLTKIASGGEISRIMLAFKRIIGEYDHIPTMIFDEIDSGISGIAASIVGKKLKDMAGSHQIICITHLAQIAAFGDYHYQISKEEREGRTLTKVSPLNEEEQIYEVARLLGGLNITDITLKNAKELIDQSSR
ncbi:MAG: DNA repair protein RecN [Eubacteriales bacterium]|nr:DNA repair protein RecN [Eubacteriales bacterium]MDD4582725.1 DNA repair protein RecN [Eubacteriales bacterium]